MTVTLLDANSRVQLHVSCARQAHSSPILQALFACEAVAGALLAGECLAIEPPACRTSLVHDTLGAIIKWVVFGKASFADRLPLVTQSTSLAVVWALQTGLVVV